MVTTDRHALRRPILLQFLLLLSFITLNGKYDGPSQAQQSVESLRSKTLQLLEYGYWDYFSKFHDEPAGRTITSFVTPHLVRLPHLPLAAALRCHLRTVTTTTDRHKLLRLSLLHFSLKISAFSFGQISCKTKRNLYKNQQKKAFGHTKLKKKVLIIP